MPKRHQFNPNSAARKVGTGRRQLRQPEGNTEEEDRNPNGGTCAVILLLFHPKSYSSLGMHRIMDFAIRPDTG